MVIKFTYDLIKNINKHCYINAMFDFEKLHNCVVACMQRQILLFYLYLCSMHLSTQPLSAYCIVRVIYPLWSLFYSCTHNTYLSQLWWIKVTISLKLASFACLWLIIVLHITNHTGLCIFIILLSSAHLYLSLILRKMLHNIFSSLLCVKTVREHIL